MLLLLAAAMLLQLAGPLAKAQPTSEEALAERRVKAAYLHRFAGYAQWPADVFATPDSPLLIGIWGNDELAADLARLVADRTVDARRIEVLRVTESRLPGTMHMLFVSRVHAAKLAETIGTHAPRGTLVVTETAGALKQGSMINFVLTSGQVRFELSLDAAEKSGLKLSSRLVAVAQSTNATSTR